MVNYLSSRALPKNPIMFGIMLMIAAALLLVLTLLSSHGMDVSYILGKMGIPPSEKKILATSIVSAVAYGGAWLASIEFPIIAPVAGYISYMLLAYGFSAAVFA